jgi:hypothetical protein
MVAATAIMHRKLVMMYVGETLANAAFGDELK